MHAQSQSSFFAKLPPEVRAQIQIEYLAEYLRQAPVHREHGRPCFLYSVCSAPISSLSLSCKRMLKDMRHSQEPVGVGRRFALFLATGSARSVLVSEGKPPEWRLVRHVRFINEMDHLCTDVWESYHLTQNFLRTLREATQLVELELEWNPQMSILLGDGYVTDASVLRNMMEGIRGSPALRRLRLRGPFPRTWTDPGPDALPGVETIVEPVIMWPRLEEEEEARRKKLQSIAEQKARLAAQTELRTQADKIRGDSSRWQRFQRKLDAWKGKR
ncbi:unnamed protein product [Clonostachys byssicola]|uniref:Uncharacterized protein n=1 Tax=Clonostachys byssicola TaxID=160290 RepID=A0A9N9UCA6_9HYPO|nr:unnamed protein product [Clonostachys byssicola]